MVYRVLECNVDDISKGGVYSLVRNVILHNRSKKIKIDIASIAEFEDLNDIEELKEKNCRVFFVGSKRSKYFRLIDIFNNTKKLLKNNNYDCVHIHSDSAYTVFPFLLAARKRKVKKIIVHSHASGLDGEHREIKLCLHFLFRPYINRHADCFVACSDVAAKWMFPEKKIEDIKIINNGIALPEFSYNPMIRNSERKKLNVGKKIVIGCVGRFAYQKNQRFLINVFEEFHKKVPQSLLLLVGEGPLYSEIKSLVEKKGLKESVIFYGVSSHVNKLLQVMDIFALPSFFEGLPISGVEAQASGLPVIFSNGISPLAALTDNCSFLPINYSNTSIRKWVIQLEKYSHIKRVDTSDELKSKGYTIDDTVSDFLDLYGK